MPPDLDRETCLHAAPEIRFRHVGGETVVLRQEAGEILVLNEVGGRVLALLDGERSLADVVDVLLEEFEASKEELERDVIRFAEELLAAGVALRPGRTGSR